MEPSWLAAILIGALLVSGLLGTIEAAVTSLSRARVEHILKEEEKPGAKALLRVLDRRAEHVNLLVLGRALVDATAAVFAAMLALEFIDSTPCAWGIAICGVALTNFAVVGVYSRTIGRENPYTISLNSAVLLGVVVRILGPIPKMLIWVGNVIAPGPGFRDGPYSTEMELRELVDIAQEKGVVERDERRMIQNVFDLGDSIAREVMVPRPEMLWIESGKSAGKATSLCVRSGHSRIPVIGETVDDILGVVYLKDLVGKTYYHTDGGASVSVDQVMRAATFVPESKNLNDLLHEMQADRFHIAMVVDEFGGIAGLISIEDILEEIVGEIADEYDDKEVAPIEETDDPATYRVVSRLFLEELAERIKDDHGVVVDFGEEISEQVDTVAGLIALVMGKVPLPGTEVDVAGLSLRAEGGRDRRGRIRVSSVLVKVNVEDFARSDAP